MAQLQISVYIPKVPKFFRYLPQKNWLASKEEHLSFVTEERDLFSEDGQCHSPYLQSSLKNIRKEHSTLHLERASLASRDGLCETTGRVEEVFPVFTLEAAYQRNSSGSNSEWQLPDIQVCLSVGQLLGGWYWGHCVRGNGLLRSMKVLFFFMFKCAKI